MNPATLQDPGILATFGEVVVAPILGGVGGDNRASRVWLLQSLFGEKRLLGDDVDFLESVADGGMSTPWAKKLPVTEGSSLDLVLLGEEWPGAFILPLRNGPLEWEVVAKVTTGLVGKGPLGEYHETRFIEAYTTMKIEDPECKMSTEL